MNTEWNLNIYYSGLEDPAYEKDMKSLEDANAAMHLLVEQAPSLPLKERAERLLLAYEEYRRTLTRLSNYLGLRLSVDTENGNIMAQQNRLIKIYTAGAADMVAADRILGDIPDVDALAAESELVREYAFFVKELKRRNEHLLSNEVEAMISAMDMTGASAWSSLQAYLTSTLRVDYDGRQVTLSEIRNLAYSPDAEVRKAAYAAELASYEKIENSVAFALNNIKNQTSMLAEKKGYASPLAMTLSDSRMSRETLDAMMTAVKEYLPVFRKYLRKKAELLGHSDGLPWYELYAPLGSSDKKYSLDEAKEYLLNCFTPLAPDMADMMKEAFENEWIDFYPRRGKEGGAFCANAEDSRQSRILTNYDGSFSSIDTLAHELGHAYHNRQLENERPLNRNNFPMPVAETASTFNEVHLGHYALAHASAEERLNLLDSDLREKTMCIVDIYSRYLFETAVFEQIQNKFLMAEDLNEMMLATQREAYGDGLDDNYMHPYMWICKSHYYMADFSFYNFPYTFGNLFAQGLYGLYQKEGSPFIAKYRQMLRATATSTIEEDGALLGIDLTKPDFWRSSLQMMADEIEEFCR
jgi:pepF/M3 family oligoendopeptidase